MRIRNRYRFAVLIVSGVAACSCSTANRAPDPSAPTTTTAADMRPAAKSAAEAYEAMWRDVADASATSDWQAVSLDDHATGDALVVITDALRRDHERGLVAKGRPVHQPRVSAQDPQADPRTVRLEDCGDSTNWLKYRADTGELADDTSGGRRAITAEVIRVDDGSWKVSRFVVRGMGTC